MVLQAAQIAWDVGDVWGALRMWLRTSEIAVEDYEGGLDPKMKVDDDKLSLRCWYGVKLFGLNNKHVPLNSRFPPGNQDDNEFK